jgi:hypothetical protein
MSYDSQVDTYAHIHEVQGLLYIIVRDLLQRSISHDQSKLRTPEVEAFNEFTGQLASTTYGSHEYKECLAKMKPALEHHYALNRHHPEHYVNGVRDMTLLDIVEMLADWKAASLRHNDGNILKSIAHNQQRFGYSDELKQILLNTVQYLGY